VKILQPATDNSGMAAPTIHSTNGMTLLDAALSLAADGLYVVPTDPADIKNPGSRPGFTDWPNLSTRDPDVIECYWDDDDPPGIAIHTGRSGLVAFDLDIDVMPDELAWLRKGLFQSTRRGRGDRGHYLFASPQTFRNGDFCLADGTKIGEIRSGNTVIIAAPTPHPDAPTKGGGYLWVAR
jgi:Bifunctional DNA primase/polymerase, N-terminal